MTLTLLNASLKTRKSVSKISGNFQNILALKIFFEKKNSVSLVSATHTNLRLGRKLQLSQMQKILNILWTFHAEIG